MAGFLEDVLLLYIPESKKMELCHKMKDLLSIFDISIEKQPFDLKNMFYGFYL